MGARRLTRGWTGWRAPVPERREETPGRAMVTKREGIGERLTREAIRLGADLVEVEYKDGDEQVVAVTGGVGYGIARFRSSSPEAIALREELYHIARRKRRMTVDGIQYELRGRVYESFGEDAFRVE